MKKQTSKHKTETRKQIFPICLHQCITANHGRTLRWVENGTAFTILNIELFAREILPNNFNMSLNKFAHLLSIHEFKRSSTETTVNTEDGAQKIKIYTFHRALFSKDARPSDLMLIKPDKNYCKHKMLLVMYILQRILTHCFFLCSFKLYLPLDTRMKNALVQTRQNIRTLKSQMENSQRECITFVGRIKEQLRVKVSVERIIKFERMIQDDENNLEYDNNEIETGGSSSSEAPVSDSFRGK
jgi:hypothetical protein|tara:strand:- start:218 stop:943 length:726 start_codon:yes stop_codon:yes gene_type:complete